MSSEKKIESPVDWMNWRGEIPATLMFVIQEGRVLLIEKLTGIGMGKVNGPGGKIDPGENALEAVVRECQEELHIDVLDPVKVGELHFAMSDIPDIHCHVFVATKFDGVPTATREANPLWTDLDKIPFEKMWADDSFWLPQVIEGGVFNGRFKFEGEDIVWQEVVFGAGCEEFWIGD